jgi:hypothetical protein
VSLETRLRAVEKATVCPRCGQPVGAADPADDHKQLLRLASDEELSLLEAASELMEHLRCRLQGREAPAPSRAEQILDVTTRYAQVLAAQRRRPPEAAG